MKKWECVQVTHHKAVGETIEKYQREGWHLFTYQAVGLPIGASGTVLSEIKHYLLFEKSE